MKVYRLEVRNFRGFKGLLIVPQGHVLLASEPGAGRSDVIEGLRRALHPDSTRFPLSESLDFHAGNIAERAEVEVLLGELGEELELRFFDQLEVWDREARQLRQDLADLDQLTDANHEWVLRLCYRARWDAEEKQGEHWVDFAKNSDPDIDQFDRMPRRAREAIPFAAIQPSSRPLDLSARATFRQVVDEADGDDFSETLDDLQAGLRNLAQDLAKGVQVGNALESILEPLRPRLKLAGSAGEIVTFLPEGGSPGAIIRSLGPAGDLEDGVGSLPLARHGSTLGTLLGVSEALNSIAGAGGIVIGDDFGEYMDAASARHLAAVLRAKAGQVWLSTRRAPVAEAFTHEEIVRLVRLNGDRRAFQPRKAASKQEKIVAQYINRLLLAEIASKAVVICEGPHDRDALNSLAKKMFEEGAGLLPGAYGVSIIDAHLTSGGTGNLPKLADAARQLGYRVVVLIDYDKPGDETVLNECLAVSDCVVRLPVRYAIEAALLAGLPDEVIAGALEDLNAAFDLKMSAENLALTGTGLADEVTRRLHKGGFHGQFIELLPSSLYPPVAMAALATVLMAASDPTVGAFVQL